MMKKNNFHNSVSSRLHSAALLSIIVISFLNAPWAYCADSDAAIASATKAANAAVDRAIKNNQTKSKDDLVSVAIAEAKKTVSDTAAATIAAKIAGEREAQQKAQIEKLKNLKTEVARNKGDVTGPYNPENIVHDNRIRILGAAQNYCMHNGILMVGAQVAQCCSFSGPTGVLPTITPAPVNLIATPLDSCPDKPGPRGLTLPTVLGTAQSVDSIIAALGGMNTGKQVTATGSDQATLDLAQTSAAVENLTAAFQNKGLLPPPKDSTNGRSTGAGGRSMTGAANSGSGSGFEGAEVGSTSAEQSAGTGFGNLLDSQGLSYSGGKGGSGSKGSGRNNSNSFSQGAGGAKSMDFGAANGDEITLLGQDPEDYFTRINLEDSIFKVVRKRYQTKEKTFLLGLAKK